MVTKFEETFNLASMPGHVPAEFTSTVEPDAALDLVDTRQHDADMDVLAQTAMSGYETIMDMARNMEERNAATTLAAAASMLKNALDAKSMKQSARFKSLDMTLRARKSAHDLAGHDAPLAQDATARDDIVARGNRNEILENLRNR